MSESKVLVRDLVKAKWEPKNITGTVTPDFSTGWWDDRNDDPQITFTNADEGPNPGNETGQTQLASSGTVEQNTSGAFDLNTWANRESVTYQSSTTNVNPKTLAHDMAKEARRIIQSNVDCSATSPVNLTELNYIGWGGMIDRTDTNDTPTTYRKLAEVKYGYHN